MLFDLWYNHVMKFEALGARNLSMHPAEGSLNSTNKKLSTETVNNSKIVESISAENEKKEILNNRIDELKNNIINTLSGNKEQNLENITEIKKGVDFVFEQNPELAKIGNLVEYSEYLNTIFPDSKIKEILYHGSKEKIENLKPRAKKFGDIGLFSTKNLNLAKSYGGITNPLIVNMISPKIITNATPNTETLPTDFDGYINTMSDEVVVFQPNQIYVLGTEKDVENFKNFVEKDKTI